MSVFGEGVRLGGVTEKGFQQRNSGGDGPGYSLEEVGPKPKWPVLLQNDRLDLNGEGRWPGGEAGLLAAGVVVVVVIAAIKRARRATRFAAVLALHLTQAHRVVQTLRRFIKQHIALGTRACKEAHITQEQ